MSDLAKHALALADRVRAIFAGQPPVLVGAALAELTAVWLAGHVVEGNKDATFQHWAELLGGHVVAVQRLTMVNAEMLKIKRGETQH